MKQPFNWPAFIVLGVVFVLGAIGVLAVLHPIQPTSHDIVLTIVSGFIGALSMKAADNAIRAVGISAQDVPAPKAADAPAVALTDPKQTGA